MYKTLKGDYLWSVFYLMRMRYSLESGEAVRVREQRGGRSSSLQAEE